MCIRVKMNFKACPQLPVIYSSVLVAKHEAEVKITGLDFECQWRGEIKEGKKKKRVYVIGEEIIFISLLFSIYVWVSKHRNRMLLM